MIFGISDDGQVVGPDAPEGDAEKMSEAVKTRLDPIPKFKLRFHKTDDGKVLVILVYIKVTKPERYLLIKVRFFVLDYFVLSRYK